MTALRPTHASTMLQRLRWTLDVAHARNTQQTHRCRLFAAAQSLRQSGQCCRPLLVYFEGHCAALGTCSAEIRHKADGVRASSCRCGQ